MGIEFVIGVISFNANMSPNALPADKEANLAAGRASRGAAAASEWAKKLREPFK